MESRITFYATANESSILLIFTMLQLQNIQERQPFYDLVSVQQKPSVHIHFDMKYWVLIYSI